MKTRSPRANPPTMSVSPTSGCSPAVSTCLIRTKAFPVKMSKSLGNYITIKDALKTYRPQELRYLILTSHYSNPVVFTEEALASAKSGWERLMNAVRLVRRQLNSAPENDAGDGFRERLTAAKDNSRP